MNTRKLFYYFRGRGFGKKCNVLPVNGDLWVFIYVIPRGDYEIHETIKYYFTFKKSILGKAAAYHLIYFVSMLTNPFQRA